MADPMKELLASINARITALRRALSHRHDDELFWLALETTARAAQRDREELRVQANLLHVARATRRERIHGTRFATLDEQRAWLGKQRLPQEVAMAS